MLTVGVRELKQQASELVRMVRETGETIQVTDHGELIALLVPIKPARNNNKAWAKLDHLAAEIGARWPKDVSAVDAVFETRR
jgi:prevent-host-death family protein